MLDPSIADILERAVSGYEALVSLGEEVEDEWTYVTDLAAAWRARLEQVATARGGEPAPPGVHDAIEQLIAEVSRITDPHRAIDWLSTYPQVVLVALGEGL
jgi:hypothetical protein